MTGLFPDDNKSSEYRVLARKYRPKNFDELVGQDVLVKTLSNAIQTGRIAHAFLLTGVRGIGKTTTARIIARALNCEKGPTIAPCGACEHCTAIASDRHMDVIEMDAASRTGVDDIRELIDGVRYRPSSARFKIYIIDEVHMLSKNAFNALLKTLEEPPESVKFIFATTEVNKIPVTVLSRCQRFDLRRLDGPLLAQHLTNIAAKESFTLEENAARLLSQAADGSVRDGLSLLDQAIALSSQTITADHVRGMLGLADHSEVYALLDHVLAGQAAEAMAMWAKLYQAGADPLMMTQDLLRATHAISKVKITGEADITASEAEQQKRQEMAEKISVANLSRLWQMLLKAVGEVQTAPTPGIALEMALIRLCYAADLPTPAQLIEQLEKNPPPAGAMMESHARIGVSGGPSGGSVSAVSGFSVSSDGNLAITAAPQTEASIQLNGYRDAVQLFAEKREMLLYYDLYQNTHLVQFAQGRIELRLNDVKQAQLAGRVSQKLTEWTGQRWIISVSANKGEASLEQQDNAKQAALLDSMQKHPVVEAVLLAFPGSKVAGVKEKTAAPESKEQSEAAESGFMEEESL